MRAYLTATVAACGFMATHAGAAEQGWRPSRGAFARYGLISEVCRSDGHTTACLALACRAGRLYLVSVAGGGGPMEGDTTIRFGGRTLRATFVEDGDLAVDRLGLAAARTHLEGDVLDAIAQADAVELSSPNAGVTVVHRFTTRNLAKELPRAASACARHGNQRP